MSDIPWETYVLYSDGLVPRHIRVTYDQGEMEIMVLSSERENRKKLLGRLVEALTEELEIDKPSGVTRPRSAAWRSAAMVGPWFPEARIGP